MTLWFGHVSPMAPVTILSYVLNQTTPMKSYGKLQGHWQLTGYPRLKIFNQTPRLAVHGALLPTQVTLPKGRFTSSSKHGLFLRSTSCPNLSSSFLAEVGAPSSVHQALPSGGHLHSGVCIRQRAVFPSVQLHMHQVLCQAVSSKGSAAVSRASSGAQSSVYHTITPSSLPF